MNNYGFFILIGGEIVINLGSRMEGVYFFLVV